MTGECLHHGGVVVTLYYIYLYSIHLYKYMDKGKLCQSQDFILKSIQGNLVNEPRPLDMSNI